MGLMHPLRDISHRRRLRSQRMTAMVVITEDPNKQQRVRIRIPQLHRGIPDDQLPWALPYREGTANADGGMGTVHVPPSGTMVYVSFEDEDPHFPQYSNSPTTLDVQEDNELVNENYPHTYGAVDQAGNRWAVNTQTGNVDFTHKSGAQIKILDDGTVQIASPKKLVLSGKEGVDISTDKDIRLYAKELVKVRSADNRCLPPWEPGGDVVPVVPTSARSAPARPTATGRVNT